MKTRVLFICHGNICRSAMAEFILKALVKAKGVEGQYYIESAAVSTEETGNPIYPPARRCLNQHGVWFDPGKRARQVTRADYDRFDRIICMDASNLRLIKRFIPEDPDGKIHLMMSYTGKSRDVADPWYTGDFETTFQDLLEGCEAMLSTQQFYMILQETYTLSNGVQIPKLGLGTWLIPDNEAAAAVKAAIDLGYRHIDTAQAYGNERGVGEGVRAAGIPREQVFITTKVAAEIKTYGSAAASIDESLRKLRMDYADLIIIHCPQPWAEFRGHRRYFKENKEVWKALEDAYEAGKVKSIGVSNFLVDDLQNILEDCRIKPMVNQFKLHIGETPQELLSFCKDQDILVEAYSPIAHGHALNNAEIAAVAKRYGVTIPQLCIQYTLQLGTVSLPKSSNPEHIQSNVQLNFTISDEDMAALSGISAPIS